MAKGNREHCGQLIAALAAQWRVEATEALLMGYWLGLEDIAPQTLANAAKRALRECEFMPTVAKLREFAGRGKDMRPYHVEAPAPERLCLVHKGWQEVTGEIVERDPGCTKCQRGLVRGLAEKKTLGPS